MPVNLGFDDTLLRDRFIERLDMQVIESGQQDIKLPAERINQSRIKEIANIKGIDTNFKAKNKLKIIRNCVNTKLGLHIFNCAFKEKQHTLK